MELGRPLAAVTPSVDGDVLRVLALAEADFTPGQLREVVGDHSVAGIRRALDRLVLQGVVHRRPAGRAYLYSLNREHLAADPVIALARSRERLIERLTAHVNVWPEPPLFGALFGSAARSDHSPNSDLDLLLVHPDSADADVWGSLVSELSAAATRWTGNDARVLQYSAADIVARPDEPVLLSIIDEGLHFAGDPAWLRSTVRRARTVRSRG